MCKQYLWHGSVHSAQLALMSIEDKDGRRKIADCCGKKEFRSSKCMKIKDDVARQNKNKGENKDEEDSQTNGKDGDNKSFIASLDERQLI